MSFDKPKVAAGGSETATISGSNLTAQTYFDIRYRIPGSAAENVALNWQTGVSAGHALPAASAVGTWTITGVRAHEDQADHTGTYVPVSATMTIVPRNPFAF